MRRIWSYIMIKSSLGAVAFYNPTDEVVSMNKELSEMSLKGLRELFPITLKEHNPKYKEWYEIEERQLFSCIKNQDIKRINHIGSSAVKYSRFQCLQDL